MRTLDIKYGRGSMRIDVDEFFPTSKPRIRKLLKIMRMDDVDRVPELLRLLDERVEDVRQRIARGNTAAIELKKQAEEAEKEFTAAAFNLEVLRGVGVPKDLIQTEKGRLKGLRDKKTEVNTKYRECVNSLKRARREGIALLQDIEVIKSECGIDKT